MEGITLTKKNIEEKLQFTQIISVFDIMFQITDGDPRAYDAIHCAAIGEKLLKLPLTTEQFLILKKLLKDHKTGQGNGVTTKENLEICLVMMPEKAPNNMTFTEFTERQALKMSGGTTSNSIEIYISQIIGVLPNHLMIKNARGGYYFDQDNI